MEAPIQKKPFAWEPLSPKGVAAFAGARLGRLWLVQAIVAAISATIIVWVLYRACVPTIEEAIRKLPPQGEVRRGVLNWPGEPVTRLAAGHWTSLVVDLDHTGQVRSPTHFQIEFGRKDIEVLSLFGSLRRPYPPGWRIAFNRPLVEPWWGARLYPLLAVAWLGAIACLMVTWSILAALYTVPVWLLALYTNRTLNFLGSWRLAAAAQMPGALLMDAALVLYGLAALDLVQLLLAASLHLLVISVWLVLATLALPRDPDARLLKKNPFRSQRK